MIGNIGIGNNSTLATLNKDRMESRHLGGDFCMHSVLPNMTAT